VFIFNSEGSAPTRDLLASCSISGSLALCYPVCGNSVSFISRLLCTVLQISKACVSLCSLSFIARPDSVSLLQSNCNFSGMSSDYEQEWVRSILVVVCNAFAIFIKTLISACIRLKFLASLRLLKTMESKRYAV
jgi:hypothetical protein